MYNVLSYMLSTGILFIRWAARGSLLFIDRRKMLPRGIKVSSVGKSGLSANEM